jgi:hypothetical protein
MSNESLKGMLKWPLIIAGVAVVLRVVLEQMQAPAPLTNAISVVMMYLLIFPIYFAIRIARSGVDHPYRQLLKSITLYAALARSLVIPTYWLAYIYQWQIPRFLVSQGGVVGPDVTPLRAYVGVPLAAGIAWVIGSIIIGGTFGSVIILVMRRKPSG